MTYTHEELKRAIKELCNTVEFYRMKSLTSTDEADRARCRGKAAEATKRLDEIIEELKTLPPTQD